MMAAVVCLVLLYAMGMLWAWRVLRVAVGAGCLDALITVALVVLWPALLVLVWVIRRRARQ